MKVVFAFTAACLAFTSASAQQAAPAAAPVKEKKVCRREMETGSIMPKSTCRTKAEWAAIDQANADAADKFGDTRRRSGSGTGREE